MKDLTNKTFTAELNSKRYSTYEIVEVNDMNLVLVESISKIKKTNQSRFFSKTKF